MIYKKSGDACHKARWGQMSNFDVFRLGADFKYYLSMKVGCDSWRLH